MKRHTVLVVDDEPDVLKSVKDLLRLDYRVLTTTQAAEAISVMEREEVHVVMTDQRMPQMTGVEFLHRVRGAHPDAIRLLFTGYADIRAVIDAINQGNVFRYITKPWDPDELQSIIREACERYDLLVERRDLLEQLQEKNAALEKANAELLRASELKTAFIKVASHELRTPLAILLGLTGMLQRSSAAVEGGAGGGSGNGAGGSAGGGGGGGGNWANRANDAALRLQRLVDQIIQQLRNEQFDRPHQRQTVDIAELLRQAADDVRPFADRRRQQLALELPADIGTAELDASHVRDAVNHLLLNAIKFTPDGGHILLAARTAGEAVEILIKDDGVGIEPAALCQLFQPFFTELDVSHHSSGQFGFGNRGLGLGLSIVKGFIEMHGGSVRVESQPGKGSLFTITLPRA
jgi:signal transduction histidine kinase